jgi:hypothetical protein
MSRLQAQPPVNATIGITDLFHNYDCGNDSGIGNPEPRWLFWVGLDGADFTGPTCSYNWGINTVDCGIVTANLPQNLRTVSGTTAVEFSLDAETWEEDCSNSECTYNSSCSLVLADDRQSGSHYSRTRTHNIVIRAAVPCQVNLYDWAYPTDNRYDHRPRVSWEPVGTAGNAAVVGNAVICVGQNANFEVTGVTWAHGRQDWRIAPVTALGSTTTIGGDVQTGQFTPSSASAQSFNVSQALGQPGFYMFESRGVNTCTGVAGAGFSRVWVEVRTASVGGTLSAAVGEVCFGEWNPATFFALSGQNGNIVRWERQRTGFASESVESAAFPSAWTAASFAAGSWRVRVYVQNSPCAEAASGDAFFSVTAPTQAGTLTGGATGLVCEGQAIPAFAVSGANGAVVQWERSLNGGAFETVAGAAYPTWSFGVGTWVVRARVQNGVCTPQYASATFTVVQGPQITVSGATTVVVGEGASLTAAGAMTYVWQPGNIQGATLNVNPPVGQYTYTVTGTDGNACTGTRTVTLNVIPVPLTWPGDANNDGSVTEFDFFLINAGLGKTGPPRPVGGVLWQGYVSAPLWPTSTIYQGVPVNDRFLDANGDGVINLFDVAVSVVRRGLTH